MSMKRFKAFVAALLSLQAMSWNGPARAATEPPSSDAPRVLYNCPDLAERSPLSVLATRIFQGYDGWFFRTVDFQSDYAVPPSILDFYTRLNEALVERGVRLVILTLPPRSLTVPEEVPPDVVAATNFNPAVIRKSFSAFLAVLRTSGALVVDTEAALSDPNVKDFYFKRDIHWTPTGALAFAHAIRKTLESDPRFPSLATKDFTSHVAAKSVPLDANVQLALLSVCKDPIPREYLPLNETVAPEGSVDDFLSDDAGVPVAVVGTSFSDEAKPFNFIGFLREALKMEVASYAISGGNVDQSIYQFLHSDTMSGEAPSYLIWELPFSGRIEDIPENLVRQLVPAAEGICENDRVVTQSPFEMPAGGSAVIRTEPSGKISGNRYYLAMTLSDPSIRNFVAFLRYDDGREEIFTVARPERVPATDKLFVELSTEFTGSLTEVEVQPLDGGALTGTMKLCRAGPTRNASVGD